MTINIGVIGTGWITSDFVNHAHATGKYHLGSVYSRSADTAKEFASKHSDNPDKVNIFTSVDDLANDKSIDTIYIASPNLFHYDQAKTCLEAGKHVLLEKPTVSTSQQLDELFKLAKSKSVFLIEAFRHIHEINFKILKQNLDRLGPIYGASFIFGQFSSRFDQVLAGEKPNIFNLDFGGGALVDLGVYTVSAAVWLFGAPKDSHYYPVKIATGADGGGNLILLYDNFSVILSASKMYHSSAPSEIYGEKGTLIIPTLTDIERVTYYDPRKKETTELAKQKAKNNLQEEAELYANILESKDEKWVAELEQLSRNVLKITESARRENGLLHPPERK